MPTPNFSLGLVYNFEVYQTAILPTNYKNATVMALLGHADAAKELDTQSIHAAIWSYLPNGTPNNPKAYNYVKIKLPTGQP